MLQKKTQTQQTCILKENFIKAKNYKLQTHKFK
jgi:hypothetical protein